ncbi:MAG: glycoside hydrolase family 3 N-terminal domain-containing protein [Eubacterium sp.]
MNKKLSFIRKNRLLAIVGLIILLITLTSCRIETKKVEEGVSTNTVLEKSEADKVKEKVQSMSIEEKVGQLFLARVPDEMKIEDIEHYQLGGYLLFSRDFQGKTPDVFMQEITNFQTASVIPMFIACDEEGGNVSRINSGEGFIAEPFKSPRELYALGGLEAIKTDTQNKSRILKSYGINVNLAPVVDVSQNEASYIYDRTVGLDAQGTAEYAAGVIPVMKTEKIGNCLKHFPGYGDNPDTHTDIVVDDRPLSVLETGDFLPFQAGIKAGADSVLISHNIVNCVDASLPASMSLTVHQLLRNKMGFTGVIMTDDFDMEGLSAFMDFNTAAITTLQAGSDLLISSHYKTQIPVILDAVNNGTLSIENLDSSVGRILQWKAQLGILNL